MVCSLDQEAKTVPRRIDVPGNPNKLAYSRHLRSLIVSYSITETHPESSPLGRFTKSYIEFVNPDDQSPVGHGDRLAMAQGLTPWRPSGSCGEKITCIFDWIAQKNGHEYHLIAVGTSLPIPNDPNDLQGRILLLHAYRDLNDANQIICVDKYMQMLDRPVYAMAAYRDTLIVASGKRILPIAAKNSEVKWLRDISAVLPSPAVAMTVKGNLIFVTTSRHSILVYQIAHGDIVQVASDGIARDGMSHSFIHGYGAQSDMIVVGTRGGAVRVFNDLNNLKNSDVSVLRASPTADLPVSMLRLVQGTKSPPLLSTSNTLYGFAINGSVYRLLVVEGRERRLLQILLNLCLRDRVICPSFSARKRHLAAAKGLETTMHIDGNILARLAGRDVQYLRDMLALYSAACPGTPLAALVDEFDEASRGVLGNCKDRTLAVFKWLRALLHIEF